MSKHTTSTRGLPRPLLHTPWGFRGGSKPNAGCRLSCHHFHSIQDLFILLPVLVFILLDVLVTSLCNKLFQNLLTE